MPADRRSPGSRCAHRSAPRRSLVPPAGFEPAAPALGGRSTATTRAATSDYEGSAVDSSGTRGRIRPQFVPQTAPRRISRNDRLLINSLGPTHGKQQSRTLVRRVCDQQAPTRVTLPRRPPTRWGSGGGEGGRGAAAGRDAVGGDPGELLGLRARGSRPGRGRRPRDRLARPCRQPCPRRSRRRGWAGGGPVPPGLRLDRPAGRGRLRWLRRRPDPVRRPGRGRRPGHRGRDRHLGRGRRPAAGGCRWPGGPARGARAAPVRCTRAARFGDEPAGRVRGADPTRPRGNLGAESSGDVDGPGPGVRPQGAGRGDVAGLRRQVAPLPGLGAPRSGSRRYPPRR